VRSDEGSSPLLHLKQACSRQLFVNTQHRILIDATVPGELPNGRFCSPGFNVSAEQRARICAAICREIGTTDPFSIRIKMVHLGR
jgi:hypothetical protein